MIGSNTNSECLIHSPCHWSFLSITLYGYINTTNLLSVSKHDHNINYLTFRSWWLPKCRGAHRQQQQHDVSHMRQDYPSTTGTTLEAALSTVEDNSSKVRPEKKKILLKTTECSTQPVNLLYCVIMCSAVCL